MTRPGPDSLPSPIAPKPRAWVAGLLLCVHAAMAQPARPCAPLVDAGEEALRQLNQIRAKGASCGRAVFAGAPALRWDTRLSASAQSYAQVLAQRDQMGSLRHSVLRDRFRDAGYRLRLAGENLAAGIGPLDELMALWLASPDHCANLLEPGFIDAGLACVPGRASGEPFWVLHLGRDVSAGSPE